MSTVSSGQPEERVVHVNGPRPTPSQLVREIADVAVAVPLFATAPLARHWHRPADASLSLVLNEFGDFPMMRKMLRTLKQRAEAGPHVLE